MASEQAFGVRTCQVSTPSLYPFLDLCITSTCHRPEMQEYYECLGPYQSSKPPKIGPYSLEAFLATTNWFLFDVSKILTWYQSWV